MGMGWKYFFLKKHVWLGHPNVDIKPATKSRKLVSEGQKILLSVFRYLNILPRGLVALLTKFDKNFDSF